MHRPYTDVWKGRICRVMTCQVLFVNCVMLHPLSSALLSFPRLVVEMRFASNYGNSETPLNTDSVLYS